MGNQYCRCFRKACFVPLHYFDASAVTQATDFQELQQQTPRARDLPEDDLVQGHSLLEDSNPCSEESTPELTPSDSPCFENGSAAEHQGPIPPDWILPGQRCLLHLTRSLNMGEPLGATDGYVSRLREIRTAGQTSMPQTFGCGALGTWQVQIKGLKSPQRAVPSGWLGCKLSRQGHRSITMWSLCVSCVSGWRQGRTKAS